MQRRRQHLAPLSTFQLSPSLALSLLSPLGWTERVEDSVYRTVGAWKEGEGECGKLFSAPGGCEGGGGGRVHCIPKAGRGLLLEKREAKDSLSLSFSSPPLFSRLRSVRRPPLKSSFALDSVGQGTKNVALAPGHHAPPPPRGEGGIERSMCVRRKGERGGEFFLLLLLRAALS